MSATVGLVVPAYRPDYEQLRAYVADLHEVVAPTVVRIELDDPHGDVQPFAESVDATVATAPTRRGKGRAITAGFEALDTDVLAFVDADGSTAPAAVGEVVGPVVAANANVAIGTRRHPGASVATTPGTLRRVLSGGFVRLARLATGLSLSDFQCGAKAIDRDSWRAIRSGLFEAGFGWDLELLWLADRAGCSIVEVPIAWRDQPGSTVSPLRTTLGLSALLGRIGVARLTGRPHGGRGTVPLIDQLGVEDQ